MGKITYANCNFYFGYIDKLSGNEHRDAAIREIVFLFKRLDFLFCDNETLRLELENSFISENTNINCDKKRKYTICTIYKNEFFNKLETIIGKIYDSNVGFKIKTEKLYVDLYFDPVDIQLKYSDDR